MHKISFEYRQGGQWGLSFEFYRNWWEFQKNRAEISQDSFFYQLIDNPEGKRKM